MLAGAGQFCTGGAGSHGTEYFSGKIAEYEQEEESELLDERNRNDN